MAISTSGVRNLHYIFPESLVILKDIVRTSKVCFHYVLYAQYGFKDIMVNNHTHNTTIQREPRNYGSSCICHGSIATLKNLGKT